jgi:hypothetical protein
MEKLHIELDLEVEEYVEKLYGDSPEHLKEELTQQIRQWATHYLESLKEKKQEDS